MGAAVIGTLLLPEFVVTSGSADDAAAVGLVVTSAAFAVVRSSRPKMSKAADGDGVLVVIHGGTNCSG